MTRERISDIVKATGGAMMLITMATLLPFLWFDDRFWIKLLLSEVVIMGIIYLLDKAISTKDE